MSYWIAGATAVSGYMASKSADKATDAASDAAAAQIAFERERYADWKDTYGGVEENLSAYFSNLTPDYYVAQGLEAFQKESQAQLEQVRTTLAQRGIGDSGIAAQAELGFAQEGAEERARIRAEGPKLAREDQFRFLQAGLGLSPGSAYSTALSQQANSLAQTAGSAQVAAGQATSAAVKSVGTALADYFDKPVPSSPPPASSGGGGGASGGGGIISKVTSLFSDNRLKTDVQRVGTASNGLGLYVWNWTEEAKALVGNQPGKGYIAQEVQARFPEAIGESQGFITIDYSRIH